MKKNLMSFIAFTAIVTILSSCKKGEHDPFLSLRSRKARVVGEWTFSKKESSSHYYQSYFGMDYEVNETSSYDGTVETGSTTTTPITISGPSQTQTNTPQSYTESFTFKKDGTYTYNKTNSDNSKYNETGNWEFVGKNKNLKIKNKEAISLTSTSSESTSSNGIVITDSSTGMSGDNIFMIDELKNKEMIIIDDYTNTDNTGKASNWNNKYTLKQK